MSYEEEGYLIVGIAENGNSFRPSDWVERIASLYACFDTRRRLHYNPMIKPVLLDGLRCLFVSSELEAQDAIAYGFIMDFALSNHLQVRSSFEAELSNVA